MASLILDLRYSARVLRKQPIFAITVILSIAIAIGANAAVFSLINAVLLKPLPFKDSGRLVTLMEQPFKDRVLFASLSGPNFQDSKEQAADVFESLAAMTSRKEATLTNARITERVITRRLTEDFLATFQVAPILGRWFSSDESSNSEARVAVISESLWKRHFAARSDVVGEEIALDREVYKVIGVSPGIFESIGYQPVDVLLPLDLKAKAFQARDSHVVDVIGRLRSTMTLSGAQARLDTISARLATQYPNPRAAPAIKVMKAGALTSLWYGSLFATLQGAILFVLLIACTNVATLMLARWTGRQQELAVRSALGASRLSLLRLSLSEGLLLVFGGTALGIWLAEVFRRALLLVAPADLPRLREVQIDARVLWVIIGVSVCLVFFFSLVPLIAARGARLKDHLSQAGRATAGSGKQRLRSLFVSAQILLTVVLMLGAGLFIRSLWQIQEIDLGFRRDSLLTFHLLADSTRYRTPEQIAGFYSAVFDRLRAIPGLGDLCGASHPPFSGSAMGNRIGLPGQTRDANALRDAQTIVVSSEYFRTLGINLIRGRSFVEADDRGAPAAVIINETLARQLFGQTNPLGQRIEIAAAHSANTDTVAPGLAQVIGVARDTRQFRITAPLHNIVYVPFSQHPVRSMFVVAAAQIHSRDLVDQVRQAVAAVDPEQPVYDVQSMTERVRASEAERNFNATLLILFAAIALVTTALGIYSTLAFWVMQRTREIGIRMAIGANRLQILALIARHSGRLMLFGVLLGLPAAFALVRLIRARVYQGQAGADLFYGISSVDPLAIAAVLVVLVGAASLATLLPAWRATRIDPAVALQAE